MTQPALPLRPPVKLLLAILAALSFGGYRFTNTFDHALLDLIRLQGDLPFQARLAAYELIGRPLLALGITAEPSLKLAFCAADALWFFLALAVFSSLLGKLGLEGPRRAAGIGLFAAALWANYIVPRHLNVFYPYDLPSVLVSVLALRLGLTRSIWFVPVLALAAFNRESALFLAVIPLLMHRDRDSLFTSAAAVLATGAIYILLRKIFADHPGNVALLYDDVGVLRVIRNARLLASPKLLQVLAMSGFLWLPALLGWGRLASLEVQRLWPLGIGLFVVAFVVGNIDELRLYSELTPLLALVAACALFRARRS